MEAKILSFRPVSNSGPGGQMDVRTLQKPLKDRYRSDPASSRITLTARGSQVDAPIACSVDIGRAAYEAQAHAGVGGAGTAACSGDLLLGALAACAQITCQMVATAMGVPTRRIIYTYPDCPPRRPLWTSGPGRTHPRARHRHGLGHARARPARARDARPCARPGASRASRQLAHR